MNFKCLYPIPIDLNGVVVGGMNRGRRGTLMSTDLQVDLHTKPGQKWPTGNNNFITLNNNDCY